MSVNIPVRPETKDKLQIVRLDIIASLRDPKVTWDQTIGFLVEFWATSEEAAKRAVLKTGSRKRGTRSRA